MVTTAAVASGAVTTTSAGDGAEPGLTLHQAAELLGVHYMTAYRYVRLGQLAASKVGSSWRIDPADLEAFRSRPGVAARRPDHDLVDRLRSALLAGNETHAWALLNDAHRAGMPVESLYLDALRPALHQIGDGWASGQISVAQEHLASAVVTRLVGRLGQRFASPGRRRGGAVVGAAPGDHHALPAAMFADLLRAQGLAVVDLGSDPPPHAFSRALTRVDGPAALCVSATTSGNDAGIRALVEDLHRCFPGLVVAVGGAGVDGTDHAASLGSQVWEPDPLLAAASVAALLSRRT